MKSDTMEENIQSNNELIIRYFSGEATEEDIRRLGNWVGEKPENREEFLAFQKVFHALQATKAPDLDSEWGKLQEKIATASFPVKKIENKKSAEREISRRIVFSPSWMVRAAAIFILLLIPAWLLIRYTAQPDMIVVTASQDVQMVALPDGSQISMRRGSVLEYPEEFSGNQRSVKLSGEAFFEVKKDETTPFLVTAGGSGVEVTGTTFSVRTVAGKQLTEVFLATGSVKVFIKSQSEKSVTLSPGEKAVVSEKTSFIEKSINTDPNFLAWKTYIIRFENTSLHDALNVLTNVYGAGFRLSGGAFENCRITATFEHQSLESILNVFEATLNLQIYQRSDGWDITGKGCNK